MNVIEFRGVGLKDGGRVLLSDLNLSLGPGEKLAVFGPSGSGKSEFLKLAAGIRPPDSGKVMTADIRLGLPAPAGYILNEGGLLNNLTLVQNAALPAVYHRILSPSEAESRARALLAEFDQESEADRKPALASAAARRLAQLARALLFRPALFVLENPLEDMDAENARAVHGALERIRADEKACAVLETRSLAPFLDWAGRFMLMYEGRFKLFSGKAELLNDRDPAVGVFLR